MFRGRHAIAAVIYILSAQLFSGAEHASAQSSPDFYKGRTIELDVSSDTGGGNDAYARLVALHISKYIPGNPGIIVKNMPGAGGLTATNYAYNIAAQDGTEFVQVQSTVPLAPLLGDKAAHFDALKFNYLGSAYQEASVLFVRKASTITRFQDLMTHEAFFAGSTGSWTESYSNGMNALLGTKIKHIGGYPGLADALLAVDRGEVDGYPAASWSTLKMLKPEWLKDGTIRVLVQLAFTKEPDLPDVPLIGDFMTTDDQREAFSLLLVPQVLGRLFLMPPNVPADRVAILQKAFASLFTDPDFLADAKQRQLEVRLMTGEEATKLVRGAEAAPKPIVDRMRTILNASR